MNLGMWVKQCPKFLNHPFGNGKHTTHKNGDLEHGLCHRFTRIQEKMEMTHQKPGVLKMNEAYHPRNASIASISSTQPVLILAAKNLTALAASGGPPAIRPAEGGQSGSS